MGVTLSGTAGLWLAVLASGLYHGVNPGMGWPLAVSAALMGRGRRDLYPALGALAAGHFISMAGILLPFALMTALLDWQREIRIGAGLLVVAFGLFLLIRNRHTRFLARIPPSRIALWSFLAATAHGAGLMLVPIYLGLCTAQQLDAGHRGLSELMDGTLGMAVSVAVVHTAAMVVAGGAIAYAVHRWLGLTFLSRSWFNLDRIWAVSLILVGAIALATVFVQDGLFLERTASSRGRTSSGTSGMATTSVPTVSRCAPAARCMTGARCSNAHPNEIVMSVL